jgi:membrane associated rhomboid family serine protease
MMRQYADNTPVFHTSRIGPGTLALLVSNVAFFVLQALVDHKTNGLFSLLFELRASAVTQWEVWRFVTYMFLHGGPWHLLLNMLGFFFFGREMEDVLGTLKFLLLYTVCGVLAGVGWLLIGGLAKGYCVGASGAVFGIMGAFAAMFPYRRVTLLVLFILPVTLTARAMILALAGITVVSLFISDGNVAHSAHLVGGLAGYAYGWNRGRGERPHRPGRRSRWFRRRPDLRILPDDDAQPDREEVDRILEKINRQGIGSLSRQDRELLDRASRQGSTRG